MRPQLALFGEDRVACVDGAWKLLGFDGVIRLSELLDLEDF